jgi:NADH-quinone oxidoreductase subunit J
MTILLYIFSGIVALGALGMLITRNIIYAAYLLVTTLLGIAGLYVLLGAEFLAVVQLLVYAGGVVVLLAFGIMITNRTNKKQLLTSHHLLLPGFLVFLGMVSVLVALGGRLRWSAPTSVGDTGVAVFGTLFMTDYLLAFEIIAYILLVALVGAAYFAKVSRA